MDRKNRQGVRRVEAQVSKRCLGENIALLKSRIGEKTRFCAVVKANGYGHDARLVVRVIQDQIDMFAVATFEEAEEIFPFAQGKPILIMTPLYDGIDPHWLRAAQTKSYHCTLCSMEALKSLKTHLDSSPATIHLHLKVDTGMGRCGTLLQQAMPLYQAIIQESRLNLDGVYTHFAIGTQADNPLTKLQLREFHDFLVASRLTDNPAVCKHACNTAATLNIPPAHFDMVRCGLGIYGYSQTPTGVNPLQPVMSVRAPLVQIKTLKQGQSCGYDATFIANRDMLIGIIPIGYADGLTRTLSNRISLRLAAKPTPVIGRISMNVTIIDLTHVSNAREGNWVTVFDDQPDSPCAVSHLAQTADTIEYEILTGLNRHIKRVLVD
jgi:alanine racemase